MGNKAEEVIFKPKAIKSIKIVSQYIAEKGYPETSVEFAGRLYDFGESFLLFPDKYPRCRFPELAKRNLHCAVFENAYVFTYKVTKSKLIIYNVIHGKRLSSYA